MLKSFSRSVPLIVLSSTVAFVSVACSNINPTQPSIDSTPLPAKLPTASPVDAALPVTPTTSPVCQGVACNRSAASNTYERALDSAESALTISQSAQSSDDWKLVASRWQEAIALLAALPASSPKKAIAKQKILEFQRNLAFAKAKAARPDPTPHLPTSAVTIATPSTPPSKKIVKRLPPLPAVSDEPFPPPSVDSPTQISSSPIAATPQRVFQVPIKRRQGGVPVIDVVFNGTQTFEMIVDTGASSTLITQPMAEALSLVPQGKAKAKTASGAVVEFPLANVKSIEVGGTVGKDIIVAIGGPEVEMGLLGHDFFGNYDVTIKQDVVEFRER